MTQTHIPIFGAGSQPSESDGAELDYLHMPSEMNTYMSPEVPEAEEARGLVEGLAALETLLQTLRGYDGSLKQLLDLKSLDAANLNLVNQVLGEGDVSIVVDDMPKILIQESVLAGVWWVRSVDEFDQLLSDHIEVAAIPWVVAEQSFKKAQTKLVCDSETLPEGVMNAAPLLTEINEQISRATEPGFSHAINLSLLPQTEQDLAYLQQSLGGGRVIILSRGYGNCRITSTQTQHVWWVQYFNSQDTMILNTLEVTSVPVVACAAAEDIADSAQRLGEIIEVYR